MTEEKETGAAAVAADESSALDQALQQAQQAREDKVEFTLSSSEDLENSGVRLSVVIPRAAWEERVDRLFQDVKGNMSVPGFRRGKAPVKLLRARFSKEAAVDVAEKTAPMIVRDIARERNYTVYGTPSITEFSVSDGGADVTMTIEIEVKPSIVPTVYTGLTIEAGRREATDEMINQRLEAVRNQHALIEEVSRPFAKGDAVVLDYKVVDALGHTAGSEANKLVDDPTVQLPEAISEALVGKSAGESGETEVSSDNGPVFWSWTVKSVRERRLPALDDAFAKDLEKDSLDQLKASIREELEKELEVGNNDRAFDALVEKLLETHTFEVPPTLRESVIKDLARQDYMQLRYTGQLPRRLLEGRAEDGSDNRDAYRELLRRDADKRVRGYLLVDAIGVKEELVPEEADVEKALEERASREGRKPVAIRAALEKNRRWNEFLEQVRFDKIREFLLSKTTVNWTEYKPEDDEVEIPEEE